MYTLVDGVEFYDKDEIDTIVKSITGGTIPDEENIRTELTTKIDEEAAARMDADTALSATLSARIDDEATKRMDADALFSKLIAGEVESRINADTAFANQLTAIEQLHTTLISPNGFIDSDGDAVNVNDSGKSIRQIAHEEFYRQLITDADDVKTQLDTLKELADYLQRNPSIITDMYNKLGITWSIDNPTDFGAFDFSTVLTATNVDDAVLELYNTFTDKIGDLAQLTTTFKDNIVGAVNELNAEIDTEVTARTDADTALGTRIDEEVTARTDADTALGTRIDEEVTARTDADTVLGARIDEEITARTDADTALGTRIDEEATARTDADTALGTRIDESIAESTALSTKIGDLTQLDTTSKDTIVSAINSEFEWRRKNDEALGTRIDEEVTARTDADTALGTRIDEEVTARTDADTALDTKIGDLDNLKTTDKSSTVAAINELYDTVQQGGGTVVPSESSNVYVLQLTSDVPIADGTAKSIDMQLTSEQIAAATNAVTNKTPIIAVVTGSDGYSTVLTPIYTAASDGGGGVLSNTLLARSSPKAPTTRTLYLSLGDGRAELKIEKVALGGGGGGDSPVPTPTPTPGAWLTSYVDDPDIMDDSEYDLVIDSNEKLAQAMFTVGIDGETLTYKYNKVKVKKGTWTFTGLTDIPQTDDSRNMPTIALVVGECLHAEPGARLVLKGTMYGIMYMSDIDDVHNVPTVRNLEIDIQPLSVHYYCIYLFNMDNCYVKLSTDYHQTVYNKLADKTITTPVPMVMHGATGTSATVCSNSVWYNDGCGLIISMLYGYNVYNCDITDIRPFRMLASTSKETPCSIHSASNSIKDTRIRTILTDKYDKDISSAIPDLAGAIATIYAAIIYGKTRDTTSLSIDNCSINIELDCHSELVEGTSNRIFSGELSSLTVCGIMFNDNALCTIANCDININLSDTDTVLYGSTEGTVGVVGVMVPTMSTAIASNGGTVRNCNVNVTGILCTEALSEVLYAYSGCTNMYNCTAHLCSLNPVDYRQDYNSKDVKSGTLTGFTQCSNVSNSKAICSRHVTAYGFTQCNGLFKCIANAKDGWTDTAVTAFNTADCCSNIGAYDATYAANETMNGGYNVALDVAAVTPLL